MKPNCPFTEKSSLNSISDQGLSKKLQIYTALVNTKLTVTLNTDASLYGPIKSRGPKITSMPYTCSSKVANVDVAHSSIQFIVLKTGISSDTLISDLQSRSTTYLMINEKLYSASYFNDIIPSPAFENTHIIGLYCLNSTGNEIIGISAENNCSINMSTFIGKISSDDDTPIVNYINTNAKGSEFLPIHMIGY